LKETLLKHEERRLAQAERMAQEAQVETKA
jgi:hypothetical protein